MPPVDRLTRIVEDAVVQYYSLDDTETLREMVLRLLRAEEARMARFAYQWHREGLSRQQKWQLRKLMEGLCYQCGSAPLFSSYHCEGCYQKHRRHNRTLRGSQPYIPGKLGRPPLIPEEVP